MNRSPTDAQPDEQSSPLYASAPDNNQVTTYSEASCENAISPGQQARGWRVILQEHRRLQFARAVLVGLGAGLLAVLFQYALVAAEGARSALLLRLHAFPWWGWLVLPVLGGISAGLAGWMTAHYAPEARGAASRILKGC